jgi:biotin carboxyl carrier protein
MEIRLTLDGVEHAARHEGGGRVLVPVEGALPDAMTVERLADGSFLVRGDRGLVQAEAVRDGSRIWVRASGRTYLFEIPQGTRRARRHAGSDLSAPMPGQVQRLLVQAGERVTARQPLLVVEAMKMQLEIQAPQDGLVKRFLAKEGDQVDAGVPLVEMEAEP